MVEFRRIARIPILDVCKWLGLTLKSKDKKTWRGTCPLCNTERTFIASNVRNRFYCHGCKETGDGLELLVKIKNISHVEAAKELEEHFRPP